MTNTTQVIYRKLDSVYFHNFNPLFAFTALNFNQQVYTIYFSAYDEEVGVVARYIEGYPIRESFGEITFTIDQGLSNLNKHLVLVDEQEADDKYWSVVRKAMNDNEMYIIDINTEYLEAFLNDLIK